MLRLIKRNSLEDYSSSGVIGFDGRLFLSEGAYRPGPCFSYQARLSFQCCIRYPSASVKLLDKYRNKIEIRHHLKRTAGRSDS